MRQFPCLSRFPWPRQTLVEGEVQLWWLDPAQASDEAEVLRQLLGPDELERAKRFRQARHRDRYRLTHGLLRLLIEAYGVAPAPELQFAYSAQGKPRLAEVHRADWLQFNLSHTDGMSVLAFAHTHSVGVDVERHVELSDRDELVASHFSARERAEYFGLALRDRPRGFYNGWTRKEAFIKATGEGLQRPLDSFSVSLGPGKESRLWEIDGDGGAAASWGLHDLTENGSSATFILALAVSDPAARVTHRYWETLT